jgi:hypothetical protein
MNSIVNKRELTINNNNIFDIIIDYCLKNSNDFLYINDLNLFYLDLDIFDKNKYGFIYNIFINTKKELCFYENIIFKDDLKNSFLVFYPKIDDNVQNIESDFKNFYYNNKSLHLSIVRHKNVCIFLSL